MSDLEKTEERRADIQAASGFSTLEFCFLKQSYHSSILEMSSYEYGTLYLHLGYRQQFQQNINNLQNKALFLVRATSQV